MKTAYLVTAGTYSEYRILAVFDNEADAIEVAQAWNRSTEYEHNSLEAEVETWPLGVEGFTPGTKLYRAHLYADMTAPYVCDESRYDFDSRETMMPDGIGGATVWIWANDEQHARKIATERWAQWKALKP